jgi:hypothetical protein
MNKKAIDIIELPNTLFKMHCNEINCPFIIINTQFVFDRENYTFSLYPHNSHLHDVSFEYVLDNVSSDIQIQLLFHLDIFTT